MTNDDAANAIATLQASSVAHEMAIKVLIQHNPAAMAHLRAQMSQTETLLLAQPIPDQQAELLLSVLRRLIGTPPASCTSESDRIPHGPPST